MATPTPAELKDEIENGPFAAELAPYWADTFEPIVGRPDLDYRVGRLRPDAAFEIHRILNDATRRTKIASHISRGAFAAFIAPAIINISNLPEVRQKYWDLVINLLTASDDDVDVTRPQIQGLLDLAVSEGLLTTEYRNTLLNAGSVPCSRSEELGWDSWQMSLVQNAKVQ